MANDVNLKVFPTDKYEALTMLFLQNQDLSGKTPEEIADMCEESWDRIFEEFGVLAKKQKERNAKENSQRSFF